MNIINYIKKKLYIPEIGDIHIVIGYNDDMTKKSKKLFPIGSKVKLYGYNKLSKSACIGCNSKYTKAFNICLKFVNTNNGEFITACSIRTKKYNGE